MKHTLSPRQVQVMRAVCRGLVAREIADELSISTRTIESYMQQAKQRLKARNIVQAAVKFSMQTNDK